MFVSIKRLIDSIVAEFRPSDGIDLGKDRIALQRLKEAAEKAKIELSSVLETDISLPFITADASGPRLCRCGFSGEVSSALVDDAAANPAAGDAGTEDAGVEAKKSMKCVLVGGMTRMPRMQRLVRVCSRGSPQGRESGRGCRDWCRSAGEAC